MSMAEAPGAALLAPCEAAAAGRGGVPAGAALPFGTAFSRCCPAGRLEAAGGPVFTVSLHRLKGA